MRAGAIQLNATADVQRNLATADRLVRHAAALGAELVVLPEVWTVIGTREHLRAGAQTLDGPAMTWAREIASELGIDLVAGSLAEDLGTGERCANTSVHVAPDGRQRAVYRKIHLFDVEIDGMVHAESRAYEPGGEIVTSALADGTTLGMSICFDLRFPELYRTRDHWEVLLRARAIENGCFVVAPNQIGEHPGGTRSGGRSMIVDPWGVVLACAGDAEGVIVADLDGDRQREIRTRLPTLRSRRPDAYAWEAEA
jgi:predicted amidohydrolase